MPKEENCQIPSLPKGIYASSGIIHHGKHLLLCGGYGNEPECLKLQDGKWSPFNLLINDRKDASVVLMKNATYIFGGQRDGIDYTSEFLRHDSDTWLEGPSIPVKYGFKLGCSVSISDTEILLIGGFDNENNILKLTTNDNKWHNTSIQLNDGRYSHRCFVFRNKVIITGGFARESKEYMNSTEIIEFGSEELTIRKGNDLNSKRHLHGMGIFALNQIPTLAAFGGYAQEGLIFLDSVEIWDDTSETWTLQTNLTLSMGKKDFAFATVPTELICP